MKTILIVIMLLFLNTSVVNAGGFNFTYNGTTGDIGLDAEIKDLNIGAKGSTDGALKELAVSFGIEPKISIRIMTTHDLSFGEIYLLGVCKLHSGKSIEHILALREKGLGWGQIAHKLGIHPSTLNKALKNFKKSSSGKASKGKGKSKNKGRGKSKGKGKK